ncbi:MAG: hypothetical protein ABI776_12135 [Nocardioidaceae bacterium]
MAFLDLVALPVRLTVAAAETTLALGHLVTADGPVRRKDGYADRVMIVIGRGGLVDRVTHVLEDPRGPMGLLGVIAAVLAQDRPLGRALAEGGTLDRLLAPDGPLQRMLGEGGAVDRLLVEGGALDQLVADDGPLERLLSAEGALDRVTRQGGVLDRLLQDDGLLTRLLSEDGFLDKLVAEGGTLDQLIALGETLERIQPRLADLIALIPELQQSVTTLNRAVGPLGDLANRLPGGRRRSAFEV